MVTEQVWLYQVDHNLRHGKHHFNPARCFWQDTPTAMRTLISFCNECIRDSYSDFLNKE